MAGPLNGKEVDPEVIKMTVIHNEIAEQIGDLLTEIKKDMDQVTYQKICVAALSHIAAIYAVDSGLDFKTFSEICKINYSGAEARAPKWA